MELLKKVHETIKKYSMFSKGDNVLIGLSGGADSVCLTVILDKLKDNFNLSLYAVYVDHGLRPEETKKEQIFCRSLCEKLDIGFCVKSVNAKSYAQQEKLNLQEAARELRYQVFEEVSKKINTTRIALAHNADDQAETVLMRLLRGAGSKGLSGIPPVRGKIVRPLIEIERKEIEDFLIHNPELQALNSKLPFMIDSSNLKTDYLRNWIRLKIIPQLKKENPSLVYSIGRSAEILRDEDAYLENMVAKTLKGLISRKTGNSIELSLSPLKNMEKPILRRVLRKAVKEIRGTERGVDFIHIEDMINLIKNSKSGDTISLLNKIRAIKGYSTLLLTVDTPLKLKTRIFNVPGEVFLEEKGIILKAEISDSIENTVNGKDTAAFDYENLTYPLIVRKREKGDYFYPLGFGRRKKLQDFFVDNKIPKEERDTVPIVISGRDIIWIVGYRMDERFKAKKDTKRFLIIRKMSI
jgi:tRNA(Ile)-lysidine synthase